MLQAHLRARLPPICITVAVYMWGTNTIYYTHILFEYILLCCGIGVFLCVTCICYSYNR